MAPVFKVKHQPDSNGRFNSFSGKFGVAHGAKAMPAPAFARVGALAAMPIPPMFLFSDLYCPMAP
jgi:hypothetical protein